MIKNNHNKSFIVDKNTKRGFVDVNTPINHIDEVVYSILEQYLDLKNEITNIHVFINSNEGSKNKKTLRAIAVKKGQLHGKEKKLSKLKRKIHKQCDENEILIRRLRKYINKDVFFHERRAATLERMEFLRGIPGIFDETLED